MSQSQTNEELELELKHLIVDALMLKDVQAAQIDSGAPLFIQGLGLDSIDALELAMAIGKKYGVKFSSDDKSNQETFSCVRSLAAYVAKAKAAAALQKVAS